jgi:hypothetical protein
MARSPRQWTRLCEVGPGGGVDAPVFRPRLADRAFWLVLRLWRSGHASPRRQRCRRLQRRAHCAAVRAPLARPADAGDFKRPRLPMGQSKPSERDRR